MVYCLYHFLPIVLLPAAAEYITQPFVTTLVLFTILQHKPCLQCTLMVLVGMILLCYSGQSQFCILPFGELQCSFFPFRNVSGIGGSCNVTTESICSRFR